jgi:hypothetical protein
LPLTLVRENEFATLTNKRLRNGVRETPLIRDPKDQRCFSS